MDLLKSVLTAAIEPALALLPSNMDTPAARVHMLTFGLQESRLMHRDQLEAGGKNTVIGPALGLWQFERGGGTLGVLRHRASSLHAGRMCQARGVDPDSNSVWRRLATDDVLAAGFARLLIWTDAITLPRSHDEDGAWRLYLRAWRPGAYDRGTAEERQELRAKFARNHAVALAFITGWRK